MRPPPEYDVIALGQFGVELPDVLGRMLPVGIEDEDAVALSGFRRRVAARGIQAIFGVRDQLHACVAARDLFHDLSGVVGRGVVHDYYFERIATHLTRA